MNLVAKWCSLRLRMNRSKFTRYGLRGAVALILPPVNYS